MVYTMRVMAQLSLYLDKETERTARKAAKASGLSVSRWVATLIREKTAREWPSSVVNLVGAWADDKLIDASPQTPARDVDREPL